MPDLLLVRRTLVGLLAAVALTALGSGVLLMVAPNGRLVGLAPEDLQSGPFEDYLVPGVLLIGLALLHAVAAVAQLRGLVWGWFWAGLAGGALSVWIVVQMLLVRAFWLQPVLLVVGVSIGGLAAAQWIKAPHKPPPPGAPPH